MKKLFYYLFFLLSYNYFFCSKKNNKKQESSKVNKDSKVKEIEGDMSYISNLILQEILGMFNGSDEEKAMLGIALTSWMTSELKNKESSLYQQLYSMSESTNNIGDLNAKEKSIIYEKLAKELIPGLKKQFLKEQLMPNEDLKK